MLSKTFIKYSEKIGKNELLIQGGGGNTSCKQDDNTIWIKASGKWLCNARNEQMFVKLNLASTKKAVHQGEASFQHTIVDTGQNSEATSLRPSIETSFHVLLPHRVVVHVHSINTLAWCTRNDGFEALEKILSGLNWQWARYIKPGVDLAEEVFNVYNKSQANIFVLENHGLIIAAETCEAADKLLNEMEERVKLPLRKFKRPNLKLLQELATRVGMKLPRHPQVHGLALDEEACLVIQQGIMWPDQVVFLGAECIVCSTEDTLETTLAEIYDKSEVFPVYIIIKDVGVIVAASIPDGAEEMLLCNALFALRSSSKNNYKCLDKNQIDELLNWDAEKYRQNI